MHRPRPQNWCDFISIYFTKCFRTKSESVSKTKINFFKKKMFLFRKKLRNESKIVFVFETFFFFQTNARNKIFLGWHAWQPYYRPGFYNKFVRGDFRKCRKWSLPEKPGTFCRILRQIAQYVTEGMALKIANVSTSCLHFFCVCTTGRQKWKRCGQSSWDNNCFGLLQICCFKKNVWQSLCYFLDNA